MFRLATLRYNHQRHSNRKLDNEKTPEKPLYFYILYSHLIRSSVCEEHRDYKSALKFVALYMGGSSIQEDDEVSKRTLAQFHEWGTANSLLYQLLSGQQEVLPEYVEYIAPKSNEIFVALYHITIAANRYVWNIDHILERFDAYIPYRTNLTEFGIIHNQQIIANQYTRFLAELASYYLHNKRKEGINFILQSLESSARINNEGTVIKCVDLFGQHRHQADEKEKEQYKLQIGEYL